MLGLRPPVALQPGGRALVDAGRDARRDDEREHDKAERPARIGRDENRAGQAEQRERAGEQAPGRTESGVDGAARERLERGSEGAGHVGLQGCGTEHPFVQTARGGTFGGRSVVRRSWSSRRTIRLPKDRSGSVADRVRSRRRDARAGPGAGRRTALPLASCTEAAVTSPATIGRRTGRELDPIHLDVGRRDQLAGRPAVDREGGHADRGADRDRAVLVALVGPLVERRDDPVGGVRARRLASVSGRMIANSSPP